ncbi:hypothetical protein [Rhizobium sp. Root483D2]|uniref:DUF6894 family protein n=1 Tax=Rhizobium sp. Root483D2 TaxID=1736545 RepID=UPI0007144CBC|nr:hypothetical protein [Rhizobium sp. Root483D2]KQY26619.1 hypothetical protein ASD32_25445 [Rhizobium sp. Root483D2]
MPIFFFRSPYDLAAPSSDDEIEFDDLEQAIGQARVAICELALDFLPISPVNMIAIEIQDAEGITRADVRLSLDVFRRSS